MVGNVWELKQLLMNEFHASFQGGHSGVEAITKRISNYFYWKGLKKDIKVFVGECEICQRNKLRMDLQLDYFNLYCCEQDFGRKSVWT